MQKRFQDKVVLVTGASSGIGKVTAIEFARAGAKVVIAARRVEESQQVVKQIKEEGGEASFIQTDVSRHDSIRNLIEQTVKLYGRLDCAFNNAGIAGDVFKPTADHTEENWDTVMTVNLKSVFLCMKYEILEMLKTGGGTIVNNSSVYGLKSSTVGHMPYAVSKHGMIALTKTAAHEYATKGIRINAVCPGWTHSEVVDAALEAYPAVGQLIAEQVPMQRVADSIEIARVVMWLCSDESSYITGQAIAPDGGWLAR
ncbi:MAG TPA: SDR family oxidoreductase [Blastocatellia bacterium]|nr:SDR family oxidoreductase [Blastocatellia bacterium]